MHTHAIYLWPLWAAAREAADAPACPTWCRLEACSRSDLIDSKSALLKGVVDRLHRERNLERAAAIHVTSEREAEEAAAFGFTLPAVREIPNGVDARSSSAAPLSPAIAARS